jgi:hypothetical protein
MNATNGKVVADNFSDAVTLLNPKPYTPNR